MDAAESESEVFWKFGIRPLLTYLSRGKFNKAILNLTGKNN